LGRRDPAGFQLLGKLQPPVFRNGSQKPISTQKIEKNQNKNFYCFNSKCKFNKNYKSQNYLQNMRKMQILAF
jgi:hypothetical protein